MVLPQNCRDDIEPITKCHEYVSFCPYRVYGAYGCDQKAGIFCIYEYNVITIIKLQISKLMHESWEGLFTPTEFCSL
jgi:hypothetical protein